jgi:hypothetical protein
MKTLHFKKTQVSVTRPAFTKLYFKIKIKKLNWDYEKLKSVLDKHAYSRLELLTWKDRESKYPFRFFLEGFVNEFSRKHKTSIEFSDYREYDGCLSISFVTIWSIIIGYGSLRTSMDYFKKDLESLFEIIFGTDATIIVEPYENIVLDDLNQDHENQLLRRQLQLYKLSWFVFIIAIVIFTVFFLSFKNKNLHHPEQFHHHGLRERIRTIVKEEIDKTFYQSMMNNTLQNLAGTDTIIIKHAR